MITRLFIFLLLALPAWATNYYVTQAGAGSNNGTSLGNAWSVATYNSSGTAPTAGDTVYFSGTITTGIVTASSGTGNGASRLTLDFSGATLNTSSPRITCSNKNYINFLGGGSWSNGSWTPGCVVGSLTGTTDANAQRFFSFASATTSHDITISGFDATANGSTACNIFIFGRYVYNLLIEQNYTTNSGGFFNADTIFVHDITIQDNYCSTSLNTAVDFQSDIVVIGDGYNITIDGNKFIQNTFGEISVRHNDIFQCYQKGGGSSGNPYGWIIRYNWLELNVVGGSGDTSFSQFEAMKTGPSGEAAVKAYANIFLGTAINTGSNNGFGGGSGISSPAPAYIQVHNTFIRRAGPGNTNVWNGNGTLTAENNIGWSPSSTYVGLVFNTAGTMNRNYNFYYNWQNPPSSSDSGANGSLTTNPLFTSEGTDDYSLGSSSPLRGAADSTIGAEYGYGLAPGATWPNPALVARGSSWDVGAYQSISTIRIRASRFPNRTVTIPNP